MVKDLSRGIVVPEPELTEGATGLVAGGCVGVGRGANCPGAGRARSSVGLTFLGVAGIFGHLPMALNIIRPTKAKPALTTPLSVEW